MGVSVTFDLTLWRKRYPEFQQVDPIQLDTFVVEATLYHANDGAGPVATAEQQQLLWGLVVAHICQLNATQLGQPNQMGTPQLVGAITNASEGSVTVQTENNYPPGTPQWWQQTKYGSSYFAATARYRTMRYRPGCTRSTNPYLYGQVYRT